MQHNKSRNYVYIFITIAVFSFVSSISFALYESKFFDKKRFFKFSIDTAAGLSSRPSVSFKGIEIGRVSKYKLNKKVDVEFYIYEEYLSHLDLQEVLSFKRNPLTGDIIEIELVAVENPSFIYPSRLTDTFLTVEDEKFLKATSVKHSHKSKGVDQLVSSVERLVNEIQSKELISKLEVALNYTNSLGGRFDNAIGDLGDEGPIKASLKTMTELKELVISLKKTNGVLYSILNTVESEKESLKSIINHGQSTLIKSEQMIDGARNSGILSPLITPKKKDLSKGVFID